MVKKLKKIVDNNTSPEQEDFKKKSPKDSGALYAKQSARSETLYSLAQTASSQLSLLSDFETQGIALKDIAPKYAHFCIQSCQFIKSLDCDLQGKKVLLALSGGVDSTALLLFLKLQRQYKLDIFALHIDHSLREESEAEAKHVKELCTKLGIPCRVMKEDVARLAKIWKKGIEESARMVRYQALERERKTYKCDYILLGHHLNDLAEDALMRQIRGTSLEQSVGMQAYDPKRALLRPFLCTSKALLQDFVIACGFDWVEDSSNNSQEYLRNRVRQSLLPFIIKENPSYLKNVANNWKQAQADKEYWQKKIKAYIPRKTNTKDLILDRKTFCQEEKSVRLRVLAEFMRLLGSQPQAEVLFNLDALLMKNESNKEMAINNKVKIKILRDEILMYAWG